MRKTTTFPALLFLLLGTLGFFSCATMSLNSPKPLEKGEVGLGLHAGGIFSPSSSDGDGSGLKSAPVAVTGTLRIGLPADFEFGVNAGSLGGEGALKYGIMKKDNPFQLSLIAGGGLLYWAFADVNAGVLAGYTFGETFQPYAGYRFHIAGPGVMSAVIGGFEVFFSKNVGLMVEANYTIPHGDYESSEDSWIDFDEKDFELLVVSAGLNFRF